MAQPIEYGDAWHSLAPPPREIQPLPGDLSPRRYFRAVLDDGTSAILANYPEEVRSACRRFLRTTELLNAAEVRVPRVLAGDCGEGWMLVEDLGPRTLAEWGRERDWSELAGYFESALEIISRIARLPAGEVAKLNPTLGQAALAKELDQTWDFFLEPRGLVSDPALATALRAALDTLCARIGAEPPVPCHRDFMVRNLMPLPDGASLVVLDHQDLRLGPPLYDLASLLNDTLFPPPAAEEALLAGASTGDGTSLQSSFLQSYHRAAAQRTLKAVGTFAKFARLGADRHLPLIAPTLARFVKHFSQIPEGETLAADLREAWRPVLDAPAHHGSVTLGAP
ncbi:MAG TPA: phosphotransferase [Thermoanaerobaculia bacterium]|nr:phosphotransferase [Thermoanaerobaculia bacterium]